MGSPETPWPSTLEPPTVATRRNEDMIYSCSQATLRGPPASHNRLATPLGSHEELERRSEA